ncbi:MAG: PfkB family carbohydrate kinase, partial [Pseudomonadota bacterium]
LRTQVSVVETTIVDHQTVLYRNGAADFDFTEEDMARVPVSDYSVMVTAGTVFAAEPSRSAVFKAFDMARNAGLPIVFDVDYRPYSWLSPEVASDVLTRAGRAADVIIGNDEEFGFMAGDYNKGEALARELAATSAKIVVYKKGPEGAVTFADGEEIHTGVFPVTALKPTGAGDSFMGGLLAALANGADLRTAILRGSASAAIVVTRVGCSAAMPTTEELDRFIAEHPGSKQS